MVGKLYNIQMIDKWLVNIKDLLLVELMFKKEKMKKILSSK